MKAEITDKFTGYHYSNPKAYRSMQTRGIDGYVCFDFDNFTGLIPRKRFIQLGDGNGLPKEAHNSVIGGLLEPEPKLWLENPEFPYLWTSLLHDICKESKVMLLSFQLKPEDKVYVVERARVERELYREAKETVKELIKEGFLWTKPTSYGLHVSLNPEKIEEILKIVGGEK